MPLSHDTIPITGNQGIITATIDGNVVELAEIKNITASIDFNKSQYKVMGDPATRHKNAGWTGKGTASYHYVSSRWAQMIIDAAKSGKFVYFTIIITNSDPASTAGTQTVRLGKCNIDGGDVARTDVEADMLEASFDFTFSEVEGLRYFNQAITG